VTTDSRIDLRGEVRLVARRFEDFLRRLGGARRATSTDPGIRPDNIAVALPYFLIEAVPFPGDHEAARSMAVGNAFGAAHFLLQDRLIDGDQALSPRALELSDRFLAEFLHQYGGLPELDVGFWEDFHRYLGEQFASLAWEAEVLQTPRGAEAVSERELPGTLLRLGQRMAPLKVTSAAVACLSGRRDALLAAERFVDSFHAGYQLSDDIQDLAEDLERGRWSAVAWLIAIGAGRTEPPGPDDLAATLEAGALAGGLEPVVDLVTVQYERALGAARAIGSPSLVGFTERLLDRASREHGRLLRRVRLTAGPSATTSPDPEAAVGRAPLEGIHAFSVGDGSYVYDVGSGLFFEADPLAMSLISWLGDGAEPVDLRVLEMNHGADRVQEGLSEIALLRGAVDGTSREPLDGRPESLPSSITSIALHLTGRCNLCCDYCYHGRRGREAPPMSEETATRAIDLLFEESVGERSVSVVFFGGEPLLCPDLIERVVEHADVAAAHARRRVSFHVTTNGTLLTSGLASQLTRLGVRILVSIDGGAEDHDRHRVFPDGRGSYGTLLKRIASLPAGTSVGARATVTPESGHLRDIVSHLADLGFRVVHLAPVSDGGMSPAFAKRLMVEFEELARDELRRLLEGREPIVGNFAEALASLDAARVRVLPCGAGSRYLAVGTDGTLYLCHRFAGDAAYAVGDVSGGVDRARLGALLASFLERSRGCGSCWARWLCGGPCFYDLDRSPAGPSGGPAAPRCGVRLRILELGMWLYSSLPPEKRERAIVASRGRVASATGLPPGPPGGRRAGAPLKSDSTRA
jgi:uncharacterized protein